MLTLSKTEQRKAIDDIMIIVLSDEIYDRRDELKINAQVDHQVQTELKMLFRENYIQPERPVTSRAESELKLGLNDAKPFYSTPRRLSYYEKVLDYSEYSDTNILNFFFTKTAFSMRKRNRRFFH